jgi:alpha-L-fucosidase
MTSVPSFLRAHAATHASDPRRAALEWFREARYGLFLHYGLYSLLGRHEWVQLDEKIRVEEYARLADQFTAERFDAEAIAQLAEDAGMRYVNLTTRHHDSFCLFRTAQTPFNSVEGAPARRDLVAELAAACERHGLGLCLYYSHGRDWKHPHAPNNDQWGGKARPEYDPPEPTYATGAAHDLNRYLEFMREQIRELLTQYGPIAAIWLDGIAVPLSGDAARFRTQELYDFARSLQPQVLVSYKQGLTGTEDFFAPEHGLPTAKDTKAKQGLIGSQPGKLVEICTTMAPGSWGYKKDTTGAHLSAGQVWEKLRHARAIEANLLLNTGPLPDGSLDPEDAAVMRAVGQRLRAGGFPP